ncbi:hypothetical protein D3C80_1748780 [compost metagenome]
MSGGRREEGGQLLLGLQILEQALGVEHARPGCPFVGLVQRHVLPHGLHRLDLLDQRQERQCAVGTRGGPLGGRQIRHDDQADQADCPCTAMTRQLPEQA